MHTLPELTHEDLRKKVEILESARQAFSLSHEKVAEYKLTHDWRLARIAGIVEKHAAAFPNGLYIVARRELHPIVVPQIVAYSPKAHDEFHLTITDPVEFLEDETPDL